MKLNPVVFGLMLSIHSAVAPAATWTQTGTGLTGSVAGISHLVIDSTGSTLYAAGSNLFRSTDAGATWTMLSITGVQVLALDPTSALTIYAGTRSGLLKSTDGGESWNSAGLAGQNVTVLAVDPITPSTLYAAGGDANVYKSTDGGQNWTAYAVGFPSNLPSAPGASVSGLLLDPLAPSTLYAYQAFPARSVALYKSTDGAQTWTVVNPGPVVRLLAIDPTTKPSSLYAIIALPGLGFSKSTDGGATWTALALNRDVWALAVDPHNSNTLYAATTAPAGSPPVIYKSTDGGQNWNAVNSSLPLAQALVISPADSSILYAPANPFFAPETGGIFKTTDAGATWTQSNTGLRVFGIQLLAADPVDPATIYAAGDEGIFKTADRGRSWIRQATFQITCCDVPPGPNGLPPPVSAIPPFPPLERASVRSLLIDFTDTHTLYAGTARIDGCFFRDVLLFKSADGGATWSDSVNPSESGCSDDTLLAMDPADANTIYLRAGDDYDGFGMRKTTDGGASWGFTRLSANELHALLIDPSNHTTLYAATDNGVLQSADGGDTWNAAGLANTNVSLLALDPLQRNVLYAVATAVYPDKPGFAGLFHSTDRGATWTPANAGLDDLIANRAQVNALIVNPGPAGVLYLAATGYGVFKSPDAGATWMPYNDGLTFLDVRALAINRGDPATLYAGTSGGLFQIVDDAVVSGAQSPVR